MTVVVVGVIVVVVGVTVEVEVVVVVVEIETNPTAVIKQIYYMNMMNPVLKLNGVKLIRK